MPDCLIPDNIPLGIHLTLIHTYNAHLRQWQAYADGQGREVQLLRGRITDLEKEKEELRDGRDILERMFDVQRELVISLEAELAQQNAQCQYPPVTHEPNCLNTSSTLSPILEIPEKNPYPQGTSISNRKSYPIDTHIPGPSTKPRSGESGKGGLQIADLLRS